MADRRGGIALVAAVALALMLSVSAAADTPPAGATAQCTDGTYSFSQTRSGTCSHHGGVATWLTASSAPATTAATTTAPAPPPPVTTAPATTPTAAPTTTAPVPAVTTSATTTAAAPAATTTTPAVVAVAPVGATARCRDGSFSFSQTRSGTCSRHGGVQTWLAATGGATGTAATTTAPAPSTAAPSSSAADSPGVGVTVLLAPRSKSTGCKRGPNPDRACSPGAYYTGLTASVLCSSGFHTSTIRNVPDSEKHAVEAEYGMPPGAYGSTIEIDHIVSLELGGSNDIANLFPEPGSGPASYHAKDKLENKLHALVCTGAMALRAAQRGIAANWQGLYRQVFGVAPTS